MSETKREAFKPEFLVLDIETTGLDFKKDFILEIGAIALDTNFEKTAAFEYVVYGDMGLYRARADAFVTEMHTKNGLWDELNVSPNSINSFHLKFAETELINFLQRNGFEKGKVCICGNSVAMFDIPMLKAQMPELASWFSHRTYDFSGVYRFMSKVVKTELMPQIEQDLPHRALADCYQELDWANSMTKTLRKAFAALERENKEEETFNRVMRSVMNGDWDANGSPAELPETD